MNRTVLALGIAGLIAGPAWASIDTASNLAQACKAYNQGPDETQDPCRRYLEGYFRILADRNDAELKTRSQNLQGPASPRPCVRMPDKLTYRAFAQQIEAYYASNPGLADKPAIELADETLQHNYPCPEPAAPATPQ